MIIAIEKIYHNTFHLNNQKQPQLPSGNTCRDCSSFHKCQNIGKGRTGNEKNCQFKPNRFRRKNNYAQI